MGVKEYARWLCIQANDADQHVEAYVRTAFVSLYGCSNGKTAPAMAYHN